MMTTLYLISMYTVITQALNTTNLPTLGPDRKPYFLPANTPPLEVPVKFKSYMGSNIECRPGAPGLVCTPDEGRCSDFSLSSPWRSCTGITLNDGIALTGGPEGDLPLEKLSFYPYFLVFPCCYVFLACSSLERDDVL